MRYPTAALSPPQASGQKAPGQKAPGIRGYLAHLRTYMLDHAEAALAAAATGEFGAVITNPISPYGHDIAEALGLPSAEALLQPAEPSRASPPSRMCAASSDCRRSTTGRRSADGCVWGCPSTTASRPRSCPVRGTGRATSHSTASGGPSSMRAGRRMRNSRPSSPRDRLPCSPPWAVSRPLPDPSPPSPTSSAPPGTASSCRGPPVLPSPRRPAPGSSPPGMCRTPGCCRMSRRSCTRPEPASPPPACARELSGVARSGAAARALAAPFETASLRAGEGGAGEPDDHAIAVILAAVTGVLDAEELSLRTGR